MQANFHFSKISSKKKASKIMKNENFSRFYKAGHSETKRAKKGIILSLFMQFIMQSICFQSLIESLMESTTRFF